MTDYPDFVLSEDATAAIRRALGIPLRTVIYMNGIPIGHVCGIAFKKQTTLGIPPTPKQTPDPE
jgi:hypothetical protein